ncbi:uncharacterized protein EI97DRAFT_462680 [Westerdykella ornata]|uniref:Uncharacterized protein n=1 Tax=Westerdykella ornata TaxID=318751 RepID=A0A6A6J671_WESOR|nr:uncharacterized protein EI97DRAFT_462680 [Westerdykella ornata]KAF2271633.1 hypothetical protein EI97DRAFT_462680 [Westerdykella ornata]
MLVVVTSYNQIQGLNEADAAYRKGLFWRIILDEGPRGTRHSPVGRDETRQNPEVLRGKVAPYIHGITGGQYAERFCRPLAHYDSDCESIQGKGQWGIEEMVDSGWKCSHWPAMMRYNRNRPPSIKRKNKKKGKQSIIVLPPKDVNPFDTFHVENRNHRRCFTTRAWEYYIRPHTRAGGDSIDQDNVAHRPKIILSTTVISRNMTSKIWFRGEDHIIGKDIPSPAIYTQKLRFPEEEQARHTQLENTLARRLIMDLENVDLEEIEKAVRSGQKFGSKFAKLSCLSSHLGLAAFHNVSTTALRRPERWEEPFTKMCEFLGISTVLLDAQIHNAETRYNYIKKFNEVDPKILVLPQSKYLKLYLTFTDE